MSSVIYWPKDLPNRFLMEGFGLDTEDPRLRTKMDSGASKVRRKSSRAARPFVASMILTTNEYARLQRFVKTDLKRGTLPFFIRDQMQDGMPLLTSQGIPILEPKTGQRILVTAWWYVTFNESMPKLAGAVTENDYRVDFDMMILP